MIDSVPVSTVDAVPWRVALTSGNGNRNLDVTIAKFPVGSLLNFTFLGNAKDGRKIVYTATIARPADTTLVWRVISTFNYFRVFRRHAALFVVAIALL